ncbi:MAG: MraY family glycosyltransferase [Actinomycetota bacterium]
MPDVGSYLLIGAIAAVVTYVATHVVRRLAPRLGWVYEPNDRTMHRTVMPDVGGLAMFVGVIVAIVVAWTLDPFDAQFSSNSEPLGIVVAASIVFATGFLDDVRELSPPAKVFGVVCAGAGLVWFGVVMFSFRLPYLETVVLSDDLQPLVTVFWLLGMTQAINLIDGLDGLAAGVVAIAAFSFFLYSVEISDRGLLPEGNVGPLIAIIAAGVCVGFLPHNFNPARIIMGDGGALLLGLLMAVSTSVVGGRADTIGNETIGSTYFFLAPIAIPLLILAVPILDTAFAIARRAVSRKALAAADKGHLHHRLLSLGHGHRRSVLILWAWTALLSAFVLYPTLTEQNPSYLPFGISAIGILLFTLLHPSVVERRRVNATPPGGIERRQPDDADHTDDDGDGDTDRESDRDSDRGADHPAGASPEGGRTSHPPARSRDDVAASGVDH